MTATPRRANDAAPRPPKVATTPTEIATVVRILAEAFFLDPLWAWAFPDDELRRYQHGRLWGLAVDGATRYSGIWLAEGARAASVWIPPGGTQLSPEQESMVDPLLTELLGDEAGRVADVYATLDAAHPQDEPHFYLSLLGTDPYHQGQRHGFGLLADNLRVVDDQHAPAYLESSNPANVERYSRYGFEPLDTVDFGPNTPVVTTMWRPAQPTQRLGG